MTANPRAWGHGPRFAIPVTLRSLALAALLVATLGACASPVLAPGTSQDASP